MTFTLPASDEIKEAVNEVFEKAHAIAGDGILGALLFIGRHLPASTGETYKSIDFVLGYEMYELCDSTDFFQALASFADDPRHRTRLHVLMYCRIIEADYPFLLIYNLLRIVDGEDPSNQFTVEKRKKDGSTKQEELHYPKDRFPLLGEKAAKHGIKIGEVIEQLWHRNLRNAFSHSKHTIHQDGAFLGTSGLSAFSQSRKRSGCYFKAEQIEQMSLAARQFLSQITKVYERYIRPFKDGQPHQIGAGVVRWDLQHKKWLWDA